MWGLIAFVLEMGKNSCWKQRLIYKDQLSLIDPRDKIVLWTELDDHSVINYSSRASKLGGIVNLVDR